MTTKEKISSLLSRFGSDAEVARKIGQAPHVPRDWRIRGSIPISHWPAMYKIGVTAEELLDVHNVAEGGEVTV